LVPDGSTILSPGFKEPYIPPPETVMTLKLLSIESFLTTILPGGAFSPIQPHSINTSRDTSSMGEREHVAGVLAYFNFC
jgi:hypothetical protein